MTSHPVPTTLEDALLNLESTLNAANRRYLKTTPMDDFLGQTHHFGAMGLRNDWRLWFEDHPLAKELTALGYTHGDDRSHLLLSLLWRRVNKVSRKTEKAYIAKLAESNRAHWARQGVRPDGTPL